MQFGYGTYDDTILVFDESQLLSYGERHCPECNWSFAGGGQALHDKGCSHRGYDGLEYRFGRIHIAAAIRHAKATGNLTGHGMAYR